jgi:hypothetical protein
MLPKMEKTLKTATRHSRCTGNGTILSHDRPSTTMAFTGDRLRG